jgi:hypothetical protein
MKRVTFKDPFVGVHITKPMLSPIFQGVMTFGLGFWGVHILFLIPWIF